jgi:hypothetical protein
MKFGSDIPTKGSLLFEGRYLDPRTGLGYHESWSTQSKTLLFTVFTFMEVK